MSWLVLETVGLLAAALFLLYHYSKLLLQYWEKRGVKGPKPVPFVGNYKDVFRGKISMNDVFFNAYHEFKDEPVVGLYGGHTPILLVKDPDLIKDILIKDFPIFADRMQHPNEKVEPFSLHLFRIDAKRWRPLRTHFSPVFTSGKLKEMFRLILECGNHFEEYLYKTVEKDNVIDCRDISAKFTTDVIGSCAFGLELNSLTPEDSEFRKMGKRVFQNTFRTSLRNKLREYPFLYNTIGPFLIENDISDFFLKLTKETIDYRIKHNYRRHDFVDALVDLKQNPGKVENLTDLILTAQAFVFFVAGFETSSITITNMLYELALNHSIQDNLRTEIKNVVQRSNGEITYDNIKEMKYLDAVMQETLRKYPVLLWLSRKATANYTFTGINISIEKGQLVILPVYIIQHDPEIFPDPEVFDPNRFIDEDAKVRHPMFFLPFGDGPRNCIGARFAKIQTKIAIIKILSNFKVDVCEKTKTYKVDKKSLFLLKPEHNIYLKLTKIET